MPIQRLVDLSPENDQEQRKKELPTDSSLTPFLEEIFFC